MSLADSTLTTIITNASMPELSIATIPHYVFNRTNISFVGGVGVGKYFGHVRCIRPGETGVFTETTFDVRIADPVNITIGSVNITVPETDLSSVLERIERLQEFDEELVFLVTDSFGLKDQAYDAITRFDKVTAISLMQESTDKMEQVLVRLQDTRNNVLDQSGVLTAAAGVGGPSISFSMNSYTVSMWIGVIALIVVVIFLIVTHRKKEDDF